MKKAAKSLGRPGAAKEIAQQALQLVKKLSREDFKCFREYTIFILLVLAAPE